MPKEPTDVFPDELVERFAALAHESWSGWMHYLFDKAEWPGDGSAVITAELVKRWSRQMTTEYAELPDQERESDREEARKYLRAMYPPIVIQKPSRDPIKDFLSFKENDHVL